MAITLRPIIDLSVEIGQTSTVRGAKFEPTIILLQKLFAICIPVIGNKDSRFHQLVKCIPATFQQLL